MSEMKPSTRRIIIIIGIPYVILGSWLVTWIYSQHGWYKVLYVFICLPLLFPLGILSIMLPWALALEIKSWLEWFHIRLLPKNDKKIDMEGVALFIVIFGISGIAIAVEEKSIVPLILYPLIVGAFCISVWFYDRVKSYLNERKYKQIFREKEKDDNYDE